MLEHSQEEYEEGARRIRERPGSEIWWIRYTIDGRERREKVGRKKDASDLYKIRKADALRGVKLPNNMKSKGVKFEALGKHALE